MEEARMEEERLDEIEKEAEKLEEEQLEEEKQGPSHKDYSFTQNRELSWLNFNQRVMEEALDERVPLFEKLNFIKIFSTNLDEFCMVRVGRLTDLALFDPKSRDNKSGMTPQEQLDAVFARMQELYALKDQIFEHVDEAFEAYGVYNLTYDALSKVQQKAVLRYFQDYIFPILSPQTISLHRPLPFLENKSEYVILKLEKKGKLSYGIVPIPNFLPKILRLPSDTGSPFIRTSKILFAHVDACYPKFTILQKTIIRVTRNADLSADDEISLEEEDYRHLTEKVLKKRNRLQAVRVEVNEKDKEAFSDFLCEELMLKPGQIIQSDAPLSMEYVSELKEYLDKDFLLQHTYNRYAPRLGEKMGFRGDLIQRVQERDWIFSYPYDSMDSYLRLMDQAAHDDRVVSIKITIYRLAENSRLVDSLCRAAEEGKEVLVLMELRARFDEQSNLDYSKELIDAGCDVIYGMGGYKVHSKVTLLTLRSDQTWTFLTQIGTGNYNEATANGYSDLSLMTAHPDIGREANAFFRNLQLGNLSGSYDHLLQSPSTAKPTLLALMEEEAKKGAEGFCFFKMNSLTDRDLIDQMAAVSSAGCQVRLIVRGICCILPGIEGKTENIEAHSIVGRFLEHARVYIFGKDQPKIYIGSADMMTRNMDHRVEILCPVLDPEVQRFILHFMDAQFRDNYKGRRFGSDGALHPIEDGKSPFLAQNAFMREAAEVLPSAVQASQNDHKQGLWARILAFFRRGR